MCVHSFRQHYVNYYYQPWFRWCLFLCPVGTRQFFYLQFSWSQRGLLCLLALMTLALLLPLCPVSMDMICAQLCDYDTCWLLPDTLLKYNSSPVSSLLWCCNLLPSTDYQSPMKIVHCNLVCSLGHISFDFLQRPM